MKRFLLALVMAVLAVSSAWADNVYLIWKFGIMTGTSYDGDGGKWSVSVSSSPPSSGFSEYGDGWLNVMVYEIKPADEVPAWAAALGGEWKYSLTKTPTVDESGILLDYGLEGELVIPWEDFGITGSLSSSGNYYDLSYCGVDLLLDQNGNLFYLGGNDVGTINTSNPTVTFDNIAQMWADAPNGAVIDGLASQNGYLAVEYGDSTYYYNPSGGGWYLGASSEIPLSGNPWVSDGGDDGDSGESGGDGGDGGGASSGGGGSTSGGGGASSGGGSSGGGDSGGSTSGGGSTGGGDGGGSSSGGGDGGGPVVVPGGGDDTGESGNDWEYDYRSVLQSINSGVSSIANQATAANGTLTNIEGALDDLAGEYSETDGASEVSSADGSALSSAASSGLSNVSGALDSLGADVGSGWSDVSSNLFGWVDGFSTVPPSVLSMGSFKINLLGVQKDVVLDVNLSSVSDWLLLIRRALILLWGAITLFVVFRLFRWLTAEIVKGIRWLLGVIPQAFGIVATGA